MLNLIEMDEAQMRLVYANQMKRDFPQSELKSLNEMLRLRALGDYDVLGAYEGTLYVGYALVYHPPEGRLALLDYLAIEDSLRGRGLGRMLLSALKVYCGSMADQIMIECERPKSAPDEALARRRIRFYQEAGAQITPVRVWMFGVEYTILALPCAEGVITQNQPDWAGRMLKLYQQMLPEPVYRKNVRLIRG